MKIGEVEQHYRDNYNILVKRMRSRVPDYSKALAEEVVQEAYLRVYKYFSSYKPDKNVFDSWFNTILFNCLSDCKSKEKDRGIVRDDNKEEVYFEEKLTPSMMLHLSNTIDKYKERDRKVIKLYFFEGLTTKQISECVGRGHSAVRVLINRFGENIRKE